MSALLRVENLRVEIPTARGLVVPVQEASFEITAGSMLGLVGESGSGKSMTAMSILNMLPDRQARIEGRIALDGDELTAMSSARLRRIRGSRVGTIFQEPLSALNPVFTVSDQLMEPLRVHKRLRKKAAYARGVELLEMVGIKEPARVMGSYPFQLSGGMRQRVMIAIAMACEPRMLIADEPTTALDVTTQAQILDLIVGMQRDHGTAVLLITHDLGLVAQTCDRVAVMNQGKIVETAATKELFANPQHDYTKHLMSFRPPALKADNLVSRPSLPEPALLRVTDIAKTFRGARGKDEVHAVRGVSFAVQRGRTTAIVGESGSGKSTTGRCLLRLVEPNSGEIQFDGEDVLKLGPEALRTWRSRAQIIFQDTYASLDPRWKVGDSLAEPLRVHARMSAGQRRARVGAALETVGLSPESADRFPHEFSGGQRQRIGIARALVTEPELVVCDEPVSALDVSVQAQILELLRELQDRLNLTYVFITHDLSVVAEIADDVVVMNQGEIVEQGPVSKVLIDPDHPYTQALVAAIPPSDPNEKWNLHEQVEVVDAGLKAVS